MGSKDFGKRLGTLNLDLNNLPDECDCEEVGFQFGANFLEKQIEKDSSVHRKEAYFRGMEKDPDGKESSSSSKRRRYSAREKGKAKIDDNQPLIVIDEDKIDDSQPLIFIDEDGIDDNQTFIVIDDDDDDDDDDDRSPIDLTREEADKKNPIDMSSLSQFEIETTLALLALRPIEEYGFIEISESESDDTDSKFEKEGTQINHISGLERNQRRLRERRRRDYEVARNHAHRLAIPEEDDSLKSNKQKKEVMLKEVDEESQELGGPFYEAMEMIKKRNSSVKKKSSDGPSVQDFKWVPGKDKGFNVLKCGVPSLLDLSLNALAKNAEAIVSLEHVPDLLRHKLSQVVCDNRKMDAHFLQLLANGSPTQIRVNDCSELKIDDFTKIFGACNTKHLTVLQLDLCGRSLVNCVLNDTLARSTHSLPALATISLRGAYCLTDIGLSIIAASAPALQSVNISQCSLLTSAGITALVSHLESTLRELYMDHCQSIDAMVMLPALKELKGLEVLSVAGIETVCDDFVIEIVKAHGLKLKELVFADCVQLTDRALKFVGQKCSRLYALDLSCLHNLTDSTMQYLANGCQSVHSLKLCRNSFSDEAIAAFLEVSGDSLSELSLNNISGVGPNTALSLAKCSRNLSSLDLSWCRRLTDDALGFIVDSCLSLRLLKLFGCTQITEVFLNGHSNSMLQIIGLRLTLLLKYPNVLEPQQAPLRYPH